MRELITNSADSGVKHQHFIPVFIIIKNICKYEIMEDWIYFQRTKMKDGQLPYH